MGRGSLLRRCSDVDVAFAADTVDESIPCIGDRSLLDVRDIVATYAIKPPAVRKNQERVVAVGLPDERVPVLDDTSTNRQHRRRRLHDQRLDDLVQLGDADAGPLIHGGQAIGGVEGEHLIRGVDP